MGAILIWLILPINLLDILIARSGHAPNLTRELATKTLPDTAPGDRQNVLDYLLKATELDSVDHDIRGKIDARIGP